MLHIVEVSLEAAISTMVIAAPRVAN